MTDRPAPSAAPASALRIWTDGRDTYVEIPGRAGPYIERLNYDHRGICHVFELLGRVRSDYEYLGTIPSGYLKPTNEPGTHNQRSFAESVLRKAGLIK